MDGRALPTPTIVVDGTAIDGAGTELGYVGGYDLTIVTTVGPLLLDVGTTVLAHPGGPTVVSHSVSVAGVSWAVTERLAPGGLAGRTERGARLLGHYDQVREAIVRTTGADVRIELEDFAMRSALL